MKLNIIGFFFFISLIGCKSQGQENLVAMNETKAFIQAIFENNYESVSDNLLSKSQIDKYLNSLNITTQEKEKGKNKEFIMIYKPEYIKEYVKSVKEQSRVNFENEPIKIEFKDFYNFGDIVNNKFAEFLKAKYVAATFIIENKCYMSHFFYTNENQEINFYFVGISPSSFNGSPVNCDEYRTMVTDQINETTENKSEGGIFMKVVDKSKTKIASY